MYKYDAFISYRHCELDKYVAENIHKLLETYKPNSDDNVAFIHIPSQTAWSLMTETYKDSTYKDSIFIDKHHTIILSSQDIILDSILDYNTQRKMIHDDYRILDLQLESVPLRVAIFPKNHKIINKIKTFPSIDKSTLLKLTNDTNAILVTTSEKSGTLYAFREVLNNDTLLGENLEPNRGYRLSDYISDNNTGTKYVIALQNASYGFTDTDKVSLFSVTDDNNKEIEIPIHLYTLVEFNKHNNSYYFKDSDDRIKEILHDIGWDYRYIIKGNAEPTKSIPLDTSDLFIKLSYSPKK